MQVNTTVTLQNRERLEEIHELVRKFGADAWHLFLLVPVGCGLEITERAQLTPREYEEVLYWIDDLARTETLEVRATCAPHAQRIRLQRQAMLEREAGLVSRISQEATPAEHVLRDTLHEVRATNQARRGCLAGTRICFVSHRGEVFPCGYLPVSAGNVPTQSFSDIWDNARIFAVLRDPDLLSGKCGACEYRIVCGGCRARAF